jgi:dolichyl-phosphate-mannose--protein O-mannosyl transferase
MKLGRFDFWFLVSIVALNLALKTFRLDSPAESYFDEGIYYIPAARDYLQGVFSNFEHPPLAKLFMAAGIFLFGDNPWGWRIPEVLVGSLGVIFIYLLGKKMFGGRFIPILASVFLTFEFSWFVGSRIAILEIYVATFSLAAAYFFWNFFKNDKPKYLVLTGVLFGLALASKWSSALLLIFALSYYLWFNRKKVIPAVKRSVLICLIVISTYLASYSFYLANHSFSDFVNLQGGMVDFHLRVVPERRELIKQNIVNYSYSSLYPSWTWVFNPIYPLLGESGEGRVKGVLFLFNPALFWGSLAAVALNIKRIKQSKEKLFLVGAFVVLWLPWIFVPRFTFPYYLLTAMPFGILLLVKLLRELFSGRTSLLVGFVVAVVTIFFFYYPLLANLSVPSWYFRILTGALGFQP